MRIAGGRRIVGVGMLCGMIAACAQALGQDARCGAGKDLVVQALERISPQSPNSAFEDALQLLKHAVSECNELGDAWYYRSLVEQHLGHDALARYALEKARFNDSEALEQGLNPLVLSTPTERGLGVETESTKPVASAPPQPLGPVEQKWALVIGIGNFDDRTIPRLNFTTQDATAFAAELQDPSIGRFAAKNVHILTDERATTKNIKEELNWIARHARSNDMVVIYVATHGTARSADSAGGAHYLVTYDTELHNAGGFDEDALYATAYPMVELANTVATRMKALRTAVILDTCYSGGAASGASPESHVPLSDKPPSDEMLTRMSQGTGRIVLAASQANEESLESGDLHHGYFTYYLLEALKNGKGNTPLSAIYTSVSQRVSQRVAAGGAHQHPVMSRSSEKADFALGVAPTEAASPEP